MAEQPKERPILFSSLMVRAILEGRKTQTRRMVTPQPTLIDARGGGKCWHVKTRSGFINSADERAFIPGMINHSGGADLSPVCPYGQRGDRLWVRETWRTAKSMDAESPAIMAKKAEEAGWKDPWAPVQYEADGAVVNWDAIWGPPGKTRVSIHMPRWASRLTLEVTEVRVQRLQEISEEDAQAEGVEPFSAEATRYRNECGEPLGEYGLAFRELWTGINGARPGCSWEDNPWVWCISFWRLP